MKLELRGLAPGTRLGVLAGLGRSGTRAMEVPGCLLYTHCGSVPHLTHDTLDALGRLPAVTQLPLATVAEHQEVLEAFREGAAKLAGLHDTVLFCSLQDPAAPCPAGYNTSKSVSLWSAAGRIELTVPKYVAMQAAVRPDWYQSLADGDAQPAGSSLKRVRRSVERTLTHLDECVLLHQKTAELVGAELFGVVEGADVREERVRSARETAKRPVGGFVLDGFQSGVMDQALRAQLIAAVTAELPRDKPRLVLGVGRPDQVLSCVEGGVDLFEGFFPFVATERGCALCFRFAMEPDPESAVQEQNGVTEDGGSSRTEDPEHQDLQQMTRFEMNLNDRRYRDDLRPLVVGCGCYCCRNHSRAYLHHLLVTKELLAGVLLMLHNVSHYSSFFSSVREALATDRLETLKSVVLGV
ncbi:queuine tRNA-ribosyltransferase accessory subunit 2 [Scleropages formosus]|uniref:Queuine tRNA-ribosyltransferase accessory subunit 2 n=1 Tax=Scleropages formosus TaxID=113540 RepID=A0A8C9S4Q1_SCLFO|nr:queuine tRNA-ribosyltransferase accessory subunit 2 [Scleropages formosus]XP_029104554.1 queuine tRNA-ribosyltransferase accessory subunit 2 [Scleropages formosus]XP_029104555.1 queuine tRNA-ribosyltransferase accessory subunit 2 [Scleropages formosus]XP_029104556.1 queuine tRNA-ribosyltransferase accessory subunit 2 [Scleropages formosus]XP_029104557.1 queuine tRNA-ribosyltransferase accessory subunit 2 [Scleropages formosus]XP_029104558.1 queuine tRNA-ribosyltransferase accessory subunit 